MANDKNPFFKFEDLQDNLDIQIVGLNVTSQVKFKTGNIHLVQILEQGIWIDIPTRSCAMGHSLSLDIVIEKHSINIIGVIEEIDGLSKTRQLVRLQFRQYSLEQWEKFLSFFLNQQLDINAFIRSTRK